MPSVTLPVAGTVSRATRRSIGTDGVIGVKSGFTTAAGGCDVAGRRPRDGGTGHMAG